MDEHVRFISRLLEGERMSDLCQEFGISRKTGYKFRKRYLAHGVRGLVDTSRRPIYHPHKTPEIIEEMIIGLRHIKPSCGPKKLRARLQVNHPGLPVPAASTIGEILARYEVLRRRSRRRIRRVTATGPLQESAAPNEVWCVDFKGQFQLGNRRYCYPLTISDHYSRYLLGCEALEGTSTDGAWSAFEQVFRDHGLPEVIRSDNGSPFASRGLNGWSQLAVWWLRLGIRLERIEPGHPKQNGRHERMHWTLKQEATRPSSPNYFHQQARFLVDVGDLARAEREAAKILQPLSGGRSVAMERVDGSTLDKGILSIRSEVDLPIEALEGALGPRLPQPLRMIFNLGGYDDLSLRHPVHLERIAGGLWRRHGAPPAPSVPVFHHWIIGGLTGSLGLGSGRSMCSHLVMRQRHPSDGMLREVRAELGFGYLAWEWAGWAAAHGPKMVWRLSPESRHPEEAVLAISISGPTARLAESGWEALEAGARAFLGDSLTGERGFKFVEDEERPGEVRLVTMKNAETSDRDGITRTLGITPDGFLIEGSLTPGRPEEVAF